MKNYLQILTVAFAVLFFAGLASAQVGSDHAWDNHIKKPKVTNITTQTQSNPLVFEPNDEPLWANSAKRITHTYDADLASRKSRRTETVDNNETITIGKDQIKPQSFKWTAPATDVGVVRFIRSSDKPTVSYANFVRNGGRRKGNEK